MRLRLWPRSLANQTALVLMAGLLVVQAGGLIVYSSDRHGAQRLAMAQQLGVRMGSVYRSVEVAAPNDRAAALKELDPSSNIVGSLDAAPASSDLPAVPPVIQRLLRIAMQFVVPPGQRWTELMIRGEPGEERLLVSMRLPDGEWLNLHVALRRTLPFWTEEFLVAFALMATGDLLLVIWAVRQFTAPMRELAGAAELLGMDVNAPPLPERGTAEAAKAARAFNLMAERIRRFVRDRTFMLTAIGHDLRTPITRLKLRAEWMEDEEQQRKMLADLDELESMVAATLAFGRDDANAEALAPLDLAELLRTILDEAADARPDAAAHTGYEGPDHQVVRARPVALKRALSNLVQNALTYGAAARVTLSRPQAGIVSVMVEDDGPGIPAAALDRVFEPFHRLEPSRNRETGGTGLGLPIARNILRAHGGDVVLSNRAAGGVKALVTIPA